MSKLKDTEKTRVNDLFFMIHLTKIYPPGPPLKESIPAFLENGKRRLLQMMGLVIPFPEAVISRFSPALETPIAAKAGPVFRL
jgi:hypothetical protein